MNYGYSKQGCREPICKSVRFSGVLHIINRVFNRPPSFSVEIIFNYSLHNPFIIPSVKYRRLKNAT